MTLLSTTLKTILSRRETKIFLAFCLLPLLVPILAGNFETVETSYGDSFLAFLQTSLKTQYQIVLPLLIFALVIASSFRDEIDSKILFLYKDINRTKIYHAKLASLTLVYLLSVLGTLVFALAAYYLVMVPKMNVSANLLSSSGLATQKDILTILGVILLNIATIALIVMMSIRFKTIQATLTGILFSFFMLTAPLLVGLKYLSPLSYITILGNGALLLKLVVILLLAGFYFTISYAKGLSSFKKVEF